MKRLNTSHSPLTQHQPSELAAASEGGEAVGQEEEGGRESDELSPLCIRLHAAFRQRRMTCDTLAFQSANP
jgi:hypothetical protein